MLAKIDDIAINVQWEDNEAVNALKNLVKTSTMTVQMSQYGDYEQVGPLGQSLPHQDEQITTKPGDIVLYAGNQISIFFAPNTYRYTQLGKITDKTDEELKALLDKDNVTLTLSKDAIHTQTDPTATQKKPHHRSCLPPLLPGPGSTRAFSAYHPSGAHFSWRTT